LTRTALRSGMRSNAKLMGSPRARERSRCLPKIVVWTIRQNKAESGFPVFVTDAVSYQTLTRRVFFPSIDLISKSSKRFLKGGFTVQGAKADLTSAGIASDELAMAEEAHRSTKKNFETPLETDPKNPPDLILF